MIVRNDAWLTSYSWQSLKQELIQAAPEMGIDQIGFAGAHPFEDMRARLAHWHTNGWASGFESDDLERRVRPDLHIDGDQARSILSIAIAYPSKLKNPPKSAPGAVRGVIARSAWGADYHSVLRARLAKLEVWLRARVPELICQSMVDTGDLSDRAVAERAGIGWSAKNCSIISTTWGSWIYLAEMVTNLPFEPDQRIDDRCGTCTKCIDACPTGALVGPGQLNAQICVSFITQKKGVLSDWEKQKIGNRLYGCDTCQIVCPYNRGLDWHNHAELEPDPELAKPLVRDLLKLSQRQFRAKFGQTAAAWRGVAPLQRNAVIALGHFRDEASVPELIEIMKHHARVEMREAAVWALGRIGSENGLVAMRNYFSELTTKTVHIQTGQDVHTAELNACDELAGVVNAGAVNAGAMDVGAMDAGADGEQIDVVYEALRKVLVTVDLENDRDNGS